MHLIDLIPDIDKALAATAVTGVTADSREVTPAISLSPSGERAMMAMTILMLRSRLVPPPSSLRAMRKDRQDRYPRHQHG